MNFFLIILSLIIFDGNYIYGLETKGLNGIDVLATLKSNAPTCNLRDFVKSDQDHKKLNDDLSAYCSISETLKEYRLICRMLAYELKKACKLSSESRPSPAIYTTPETSADICKRKNVLLTNEWILSKITKDGGKKIGVNANDLCDKVTSDKNTIQLARFAYKIAPRLRQDDLSKQNKG